MKRYNFYIVLPLLASLFIYLFYRTDRTVVNELFIRIFSLSKYEYLKNNINNNLPLSKLLIYSLPEGLWVFAAPLTSKYFYFEVTRRKVNCAIIPLIFSALLELFQLLNITNGRFDFLDLGFSFAFWFLAYYFVKTEFKPQNIFRSFGYRGFAFTSSYAIVFLAHVWK